MDALDIGHLLARAAGCYPDRPAWLDGETVVSFRQAENRTNRLARALVDLGMRSGDRIGMLLPNCHQGLESILAPMKAGMAVVPMNARLQPREHEFLLNDSGAFALIYAQEFRDHVAEFRGSLDTVKHFICVGDTAAGDLSYDALLESASNDPPATVPDPDDLAWLFYTSGTTGQPKGAMLTHRNLTVMAQSYLLDINPVAPEDVLLHAAPITHGSGLCMFHHLARGATSAFPGTRRFEPREIFAAIERYRVTTLFLAPTMINMLVGSEDRGHFDLSSLHTVIYGGGPMYTEHLVAAIGALGSIFVQIFGQGEAPMAITTLPIAEHRIDGDPAAMRRLASAGRAVTGVRVSVVDDDDRESPTGETGEIVVRGDLVMKGYWNNAAATRETLRNGWLHTGDLGNLDSDGYLYVTDRKKDMIISGGSNIYPREVEEVVAAHPAVLDVAVIGVPHEKWGETVKALVVLDRDGTATAEDILDFCRQNLAGYKKPTSVEFLPVLPKNAYGKVLKRELRDRYWSGHERRI